MIYPILLCSGTIPDRRLNLKEEEIYIQAVEFLQGQNLQGGKTSLLQSVV